MAVLLQLSDTDDLAEIVEGLIAGADAKQATAPETAARWRNLAHNIGDGLDLLPHPSN
ncbi:hypothetical protein [Streptomyces arenae]|uniref:hypothetical protein n=1 Tax=Streptomyces arenae TaxID=29301 RepID=UPI00265A0F75|nr:hypothetical protein [Streptomyces arenae]MCG7203995.1 hypothetical protein [Streptomyces arenae]